MDSKSGFGVVFDLDGVLLDSLENMRHAWGKMPESLVGQITFETFRTSIGLPFSEAMHSLGILNEAEEVEELFRAESNRAIDYQRLFDGVPSQLETLSKKGFRVALFTSKDCERTRKILDKFQLSFEHVLCPAEDLRGKPHPDQLFSLFESWDLSPDRICYFGDTIFDFEAARAAGVEYFHCGWGYGDPPPELGEDFTILYPGEIASRASVWADRLDEKGSN